MSAKETQAKGNDWLQATKDAVCAAGNQASVAAVSAKDTTVSAATGAFNKASEATISAKDATVKAATGAKDSTVDAAVTAKDTTVKTATEAKDKAVAAGETGQKETGGFLQQTGETVVNYAQGGLDNVKNAFGMGGGK